MTIVLLTTTEKRLQVKNFPINRAEFIIGRSSEADQPEVMERLYVDFCQAAGGELRPDSL